MDQQVADNSGDVKVERKKPFAPSIEDEVSPLKSVIVHRPGLEMERLTPPNHDHLLFDDLLSPTKAKEEHAYFVDLMERQGIEVVEFVDLFRETLEDPAAKQFVLENTVNRDVLGPLLAPEIIEWAGDLSAYGVSRLCIEGITKAEWHSISDSVPSLVDLTLEDDDFLIGPLPNHLFTRDASVWLYGGVAINSMSRQVRRRESLHYSAVYQHHPRFKDAGFEIWTSGFSGANRSVEGGDILVLGNGVLAVGVSERTTAQGVEHLATALFKEGRAHTILAVRLPERREFMHLDTVMTQIDRDSFVLYPGIGNAGCILLQQGEGSIHVEDLGSDLKSAMERVMGRSLRFIWPDATTAELSREQWNDGFNMLALAPGQVVAYTRTPRSNNAMRDAGIEVLEIDGSELGRGRGGPRCMSCPIERTSDS